MGPDRASRRGTPCTPGEDRSTAAGGTRSSGSPEAGRGIGGSIKRFKDRRECVIKC